jgi:hypothetical protein
MWFGFEHSIPSLPKFDAMPSREKMQSFRRAATPKSSNNAIGATGLGLEVLDVEPELCGGLAMLTVLVPLRAERLHC